MHIPERESLALYARKGEYQSSLLRLVHKNHLTRLTQGTSFFRESCSQLKSSEKKQTANHYVVKDGDKLQSRLGGRSESSFPVGLYHEHGLTQYIMRVPRVSVGIHGPAVSSLGRESASGKQAHQ